MRRGAVAVLAAFTAGAVLGAASGWASSALAVALGVAGIGVTVWAMRSTR